MLQKQHLGDVNKGIIVRDLLPPLRCAGQRTHAWRPPAPLLIAPVTRDPTNLLFITLHALLTYNPPNAPTEQGI
eukprot:449841-Pyramimonas_sp.AAC.1